MLSYIFIYYMLLNEVRAFTFDKRNNFLKKSTPLYLFKDAFKNDPKYINTNKKNNVDKPQVLVNFNNKKEVQVPVGINIEQVAKIANVNIPFNCRNGKCGTCQILINNKKVAKACQTKTYGSKMNITTK